MSLEHVTPDHGVRDAQLNVAVERRERRECSPVALQYELRGRCPARARHGGHHLPSVGEPKEDPAGSPTSRGYSDLDGALAVRSTLVVANTLLNLGCKRRYRTRLT